MATNLNIYAQLHSSPLSPLEEQVLKFTEEHHAHAHMISGHVQGMLLKMISKLIKPTRILEIGTFTGFSALCLSEGLAENAKLYTIELRASDAQTAASFFEQSEKKNQIHLLTGDARNIIPTLEERWDLVFMDADKTSYIDYYEMVVPQMANNGLIIADNVLFHGEVLQDELKGKNAKAIDAFNKHVLADSRSENVFLTDRDGLLLIRKK